MGLPGAGKTTLAKALLKYLDAEWLNADKVRQKQMTGIFHLQEDHDRLKE